MVTTLLPAQGRLLCGEKRLCDQHYYWSPLNSPSGFNCFGR